METKQSDIITETILKYPKKELIEIKKNEFLFNEGDEDTCVYFLEEGDVKILKKKWVLWSAKADELIGISSFFADKLKYEFSAKGSENSRLYRIENADFKNILLTDSKFSRAVMTMLCDRIRFTNNRTKSLLEQPSKGRLINEIIHKARETKVNKIPYDLEDLSGLVGVSERLVRNMISELEQKKLIERQKGTLLIHDLKGLEIISKLNSH